MGIHFTISRAGILIFFLLMSSALHAADREVEIVEGLIHVTTQNLQAQHTLLVAITRFKEARVAFVEEPTSRLLATRLVRAATAVHQQIEQEHLSHLFEKDFLSEIQFFTQVGAQHKP